jgi:hypothetical protein
MLKVTLVPAVIYLNILLFNGCGENRGPDNEEIRYENKLDSLYERKIDSAYAKMGPACDSTLRARWTVLSGSILRSHRGADTSHLPEDTAGKGTTGGSALAHPAPGGL